MATTQMLSCHWLWPFAFHFFMLVESNFKWETGKYGKGNIYISSLDFVVSTWKIFYISTALLTLSPPLLCFISDPFLWWNLLFKSRDTPSHLNSETVHIRKKTTSKVGNLMTNNFHREIIFFTLMTFSITFPLNFSMTLASEISDDEMGRFFFLVF